MNSKILLTFSTLICLALLSISSYAQPSVIIVPKTLQTETIGKSNISVPYIVKYENFQAVGGIGPEHILNAESYDGWNDSYLAELSNIQPLLDELGYETDGDIVIYYSMYKVCPPCETKLEEWKQKLDIFFENEPETLVLEFDHMGLLN